MCADYRYAALTPQQRMVNPNLRRLDFAQRYLAPGFDARDDQTAIRILANYQEEMEKPRPNVLIAATYIAMVATVSVTAAVVEQLNAILCVAGAPKRVAAIADAVKQQQTK
ncbi:MAG: hypothetical protein KIT18_12790 [Burkholderiales bacterium]|nr:hypothetical protein [Dokdonella sp.]MCW5605411.1 hypothetical protein [Burkholderiales bacterium]